jgi:hypothetical protein
MFAMSLAIWAAFVASGEASVASRIFVGNVLITCVLSSTNSAGILSMALLVVSTFKALQPISTSSSGRLVSR